MSIILLIVGIAFLVISLVAGILFRIYASKWSENYANEHFSGY